MNTPPIGAGKHITFKLASEQYGIEIVKVREIIGLMHITRLPRASPFVRGVINLRGRVIPVVDLRLKFGLPAVEPTDQTVIIVVQCAQAGGSGATMGLLVDEVLEVLNIQADQIEPPPILDDGELLFIRGVGKANDRVTFLLDIDRTLTSVSHPSGEVLAEKSAGEAGESGFG